MTTLITTLRPAQRPSWLGLLGVVALVAAEGFERVPSDQKRMRDDKFTVFSH